MVIGSNPLSRLFVADLICSPIIEIDRHFERVASMGKTRKVIYVTDAVISRCCDVRGASIQLLRGAHAASAYSSERS